MTRAYRLLKTYGITLDQYAELLHKQKNCCAVCLKEASAFSTNLCVDHDHKTGEVRGLLCNYCNRRLVGRHRDPILLRRIASYVEQGSGWFVPLKQKKKKKRKKKRK